MLSASQIQSKSLEYYDADVDNFKLLLPNFFKGLSQTPNRAEINEHCLCTQFSSNQKCNKNFRGAKCDFGTDFISNRTIMNEQFLTSFHKILHITCLLYTSPSPRDGLLSRMPSSA